MGAVGYCVSGSIVRRYCHGLGGGGGKQKSTTFENIFSPCQGRKFGGAGWKARVTGFFTGTLQGGGGSGGPQGRDLKSYLMFVGHPAGVELPGRKKDPGSGFVAYIEMVFIWGPGQKGRGPMNTHWDGSKATTTSTVYIKKPLPPPANDENLPVSAAFLGCSKTGSNLQKRRGATKVARGHGGVVVERIASRLKSRRWTRSTWDSASNDMEKCKPKKNSSEVFPFFWGFCLQSLFKILQGKGTQLGENLENVCRPRYYVVGKKWAVLFSWSYSAKSRKGVKKKSSWILIASIHKKG